MKQLIIFVFLIFFGCKTIDNQYLQKQPIKTYEYKNQEFKYQIVYGDTVWLYVSPYDLDKKMNDIKKK